MYARRTRQEKKVLAETLSFLSVASAVPPVTVAWKQSESGKQNASPALGLAAIAQKVEMSILGAKDARGDADWLGVKWATSGNEIEMGWNTPWDRIWILAWGT